MTFLFVDRILQLSPGQYVQGIKHVTRDDIYLTRDTSGQVCFIPSLVGETLGQLAAWNVMSTLDFTHRPVAGIAACARLYRPAYLGETLLLESFIDSLDDTTVRYHSAAYVGKELLFTIEDAFGPLLPMQDFIDPACAKWQFSEINRPGDWSQLSEELAANVERISDVVTATPMTFDHIISCEPGKSLSAEKRVSRAASYFPQHFPNKPVLPMTVLLECKLNLAQEFIRRSDFGAKYRVSEVRKIKMNDFIVPGDVVHCTLELKEQEENRLVISYRSFVHQKRVCVLEIVMLAEGAL